MKSYRKKLDRIRYINIQRIIRSTFDTSADRNKQKNQRDRETDKIKMCSVWQQGVELRLNSASVWPISAND